MAKKSVAEFAGRQIGKLFRWILICIVIAYVASWFIGTIMEMIAGGDMVSPVWILGM